jgi:predicted glycoside hydrolase/deacetylase ChbG (UPF0249 family)
MTSQRKDFPKDTGFLEGGWKMRDVERELRAQIELALRHVKQVSHLSSHMGTPTCTPKLRALVQKLAREYGLAPEDGGPSAMSEARYAGGFGGEQDYRKKEAILLKILQQLTPGLWLFVDHPGLDVAEMRALGHKGYEHVAVDREGVTRALCSRRVRQLVERRGIQLLSYGDVQKAAARRSMRG